MRLLLLEDDQDLAEALVQGLKQKDFLVDWVNEGKPVEFFSFEPAYDLIIIDLGLPNISGLQVLKSLRKANINTPVIILTAQDTTEDCIEALNHGADDYMTKPFDLNELEARIRALCRRISGRSEATIHYKNLSLDPLAHTVALDGKLIYLPRREFSLLEKLLENTGKVLSRDHLMASLYNWNEEVDSNAIEVHIHNLRKKLDLLSLRTIRGVGYLLEKEQK